MQVDTKLESFFSVFGIEDGIEIYCYSLLSFFGRKKFLGS